MAALLSVEEQLQRAGLELLGFCTDLSRHAPNWRHDAAMLEDLTPAETDTLGALMPRVRAQPGQALIREGDVGDWMLIILSGTVDVIKISVGGNVPISPYGPGRDEGASGQVHQGVSRLAVIKHGAAVGEMSMLDAAPRYASCIAIDQVEAGVLTRAAVAHLIHEHPAIGAKLLVKLTQLLAQRLRNTSNQLVRLLQARDD